MVGTWIGHGRELVIDTAGGFQLNYRTYIDCTSKVRTGCDRTVEDTIEGGANILGYISRVQNSSTVTIFVTSSTVKEDVPPGELRLGLDRGHDAVAPITGSLRGLPFCGSAAPAGYCGA